MTRVACQLKNWSPDSEPIPEAGRLLQQIEALMNGTDEIKGIIRDPAVNLCIRLPIGSRAELVSGLDRKSLDAAERRARRSGRGDFAFLVGQPEEIRNAYRAATGIDY